MSAVAEVVPEVSQITNHRLPFAYHLIIYRRARITITDQINNATEGQPLSVCGRGNRALKTGVAVVDDSGGFRQQRRAAPQLPHLGLLSFGG